MKKIFKYIIYFININIYLVEIYSAYYYIILTKIIFEFITLDIKKDINLNTKPKSYLFILGFTF